MKGVTFVFALLPAAALVACGGQSQVAPGLSTSEIAQGSSTSTAASSLSSTSSAPAVSESDLQAGARGHHIWYVSASARAGGNGSISAPFNSLSQVQSASSPGDTIVVEPAPTSVPPLNGGIALKPGQRLVGGGPPVLSHGRLNMPGGLPVVGASGLSALPRITNTTASTNNGDGIDLANNTQVTNIVVDGSYLRGIYGTNVTGVKVYGNDVSGQNTSDGVGFVVLPFYLELYAAGQAISSTPVSLNAGWAGIMFDESSGNSQFSINGNYVHDGSCGDGIDIRSMGNASAQAQVNGNFVTRLPQCSSVQTMEGIGMQASGSGSLAVTVFGDTEENNGSPGANADSLFVNLADSGKLTEVIDHNVYNTGIGGPSTNGFEYLLSNGDAVGYVQIENSTFTTDPGDMLEEFDRGVNSKQTLILNNVLAENTTYTGGLPTYANPAGTATSPDNTGECMNIASVGSGDQTIFQMDNSELENCDNDGINVTNNHVDGDGGAANPQSVQLSIANSKIVSTRYYGLWINKVTGLNNLQVSVQNTEFANSSSGEMVAFDQQSTATNGQYAIDLGGGALGSAGRNCILNGKLLDLESTGFNVSAKDDWWGSKAGPLPGTVSARPAGYTIDDSPWLQNAPPACAENP